MKGGTPSNFPLLAVAPDVHRGVAEGYPEMLNASGFYNLCFFIPPEKYGILAQVAALSNRRL